MHVHLMISLSCLFRLFTGSVDYLIRLSGTRLDLVGQGGVLAKGGGVPLVVTLNYYCMTNVEALMLRT